MDSAAAAASPSAGASAQLGELSQLAFATGAARPPKLLCVEAVIADTLERLALVDHLRGSGGGEAKEPAMESKVALVAPFSPRGSAGSFVGAWRREKEHIVNMLRQSIDELLVQQQCRSAQLEVDEASELALTRQALGAETAELRAKVAVAERELEDMDAEFRAEHEGLQQHVASLQRQLRALRESSEAHLSLRRAEVDAALDSQKLVAAAAERAARAALAATTEKLERERKAGKLGREFLERKAAAVGEELRQWTERYEAETVTLRTRIADLTAGRERILQQLEATEKTFVAETEAKAAREAEEARLAELAQRRGVAAVRIQSFYRGYRVRKDYRRIKAEAKKSKKPAGRRPK